MSTYRVWSTNLLTGRVTADWIPLVVTDASMVLCGIGTMNGYLDLQQDPTRNLAWLRALQPRKTVLWLAQDNLPIWCGILWDIPHQSVLSHQVPVQAKTLESLFAKRLITGALVIDQTDILDIARQLIQYATSPQLGLNTGIGGLQLAIGEAGVTDSWTFGTSDTVAAGVDTYYGVFSDYQASADALSAVSSSDGFEFSFAPIPAGAGAGILLRLGYPHLGVATPQWTLQHPGNVVDYGYPLLGSNSVNHLIGTATANGGASTYTSQAPHGIDYADLAAGAPLLQQQVAWPGQGVESQAQIDAYVDALLPAMSGNTTAPSVQLQPDTHPLLREVGLGDALNLAATSDYHPADPDTGAPGLQVTGRLTGWTLNPPREDQAEKITVTLGSTSGYVSTEVA